MLQKKVSPQNKEALLIYSATDYFIQIHLACEKRSFLNTAKLPAFSL